MKISKKINSPNLWLNNFPWKRKNDHKYSRGKLVVVGSQSNMVGATILASEAALRVGIGSVKIICSKKTLPIYSLKFPSSLKKVIINLKSFKKLSSNKYKLITSSIKIKSLAIFEDTNLELLLFSKFLIKVGINLEGSSNCP